MRGSLARDLARWERGVLSAADLELRNPGRAIGLLALYGRLAELGGVAVPDPEAAWERLRERLPEHRVAVPVRTTGRAFSLRRLVARPLALAAALLLFGAALGYAAAPEAVNRRVASVWESVEDLFRNEPSEDRPIRLPGGELPGVAPADSEDEGGDDGRGRSGDDGNRREGGDRDREGSDDDSGGHSDESREGLDDDSDEGSDGDREGTATDDSGEDSDEDFGEGEEGNESHEAQERDISDD